VRLRPVSGVLNRLRAASERQATGATATRTLGMAPTVCLLAKFSRPSEFGENKVITHKTTDDNMTVTLIKDDSHKGTYATDTYALRNRDGKYVGTLCVTSNGAMVLTSASGYKLTDAPQ